jgi:citrate synthase
VGNSRYLTAEEAARELGVNRSTLYAYASRGLIRSEAVLDDKRARGYRAEDVAMLKRRGERGSERERSVENALYWGSPAIESEITLLANNTFYYRGHDAIDLALSRTVQEVASLIWLGDFDALPRSEFDTSAAVLPQGLNEVIPELKSLPPIEAVQTLLTWGSVEDLAAFDLRPQAVARTGARVLELMTKFLTGRQSEQGGVVERLQASWCPDGSGTLELLNAALILCADNDVNVTSFAVRCAAAAGATPYNSVVTGLIALQGVKHRGFIERTESFFKEIETPDQIRPALERRLKRGEDIPGFGHEFYHNGDPRAKTILALLEADFPDSPSVRLSRAIVQETYSLIHEKPSVDYGLVVLASAFGMPQGSAMMLFALARTIGWIGHAIEQYVADQDIRPRSRYVGPFVEAGEG